jgi:hypothetical protein
MFWTRIKAFNSHEVVITNECDKMDNGKRFSEIQCPLCEKRFRVRKGKPRTLKQWRIALMMHLTVSLRHHLTFDKAEPIIAKYFKSLGDS